jgi:hypothetical protein
MAGILDFFKKNTGVNSDSVQTGKSQWDWGGKIIPLALAAMSDPQVANSFIQSRNNAIAMQQAEEERKRAKEWEDFQRKIIKDKYMDVTPEMASKTRGTKFQDFYWEPDQTKTTTQIGDQNPLLDMSFNELLEANKPNNFNLTPGLNGVAPLFKAETKTEVVPGAMKQQLVSKEEYLNQLNDIETQKANQEAIEQKNKIYQSFIDSISDPQLKMVLETAYQTGNTNMLNKAMESMIPKQEQGMTPYQKEQIAIEWYKAKNPVSTQPKPGQITQDQRDFINRISSMAGRYRSLNDYLADLNRNRDKIIQKTNTEVYNALVNDAKTNANNIWRQKTIGSGENLKTINLPGPQFQPGIGSPMASIFGGSPRTYIVDNKNSNKQPNNSNNKTNPTVNQRASIDYDVQQAIKDYGSIDAAINAALKSGLTENNPMVKALREAKKKKSPQNLLAKK